MSLACPAFIERLDPGLCRAVDIYCERASAALDAEPLNAVSNAAFLIAAWAAWRLLQHQQTRPDSVLVASLPWVIGIVGVGSFVFHTVATRWAEWADVIPILVFMLIYLWQFLRRFFGWPVPATLVAVTVLIGSTLYIDATVPADILWGGTFYLPTVLTLIACALALALREAAAGLQLLAATLLFIVSFAARTLDMPVCASFPYGTHYLWHILNATVLYLLTRIAILHGTGPVSDTAAAR